jgi:hypothetical protein
VVFSVVTRCVTAPNLVDDDDPLHFIHSGSCAKHDRRAVVDQRFVIAAEASVKPGSTTGARRPCGFAGGRGGGGANAGPQGVPK